MFSKMPRAPRCAGIVRGIFIFACLALFGIAAHAGDLQRHSYSRPAMGSVFRIELYAQDATVAEKAAEAAFQRIEALNQCASDYLPESELSRLNKAPANSPIKVSEDLFVLVARSSEISAQTDGAFDITATYAIQHWRRARRQKKLPTAEQTQRAIAMTDWSAVKLDEKERTVTKMKEGLLLDLGGIGKGFAADAALAVLKEHGITRALVAGSGDVAAGDAPPGKAGWDVALRTFEAPEEKEQLTHVMLKNCGCSTSGDLHQFVELDGKRYSHIVDPRTGLGLTDRIACTVISPDATTSDGLATALCVLGVEKGLRVAEKSQGTVARFVWLTEDGVRRTRESSGFQGLVQPK
ncbi:thiamine biosynthesis lipoprotein [Roseimicrobium gellanilyticum]|uniref:FAD:protein FMN transferase n=1 Tax=Roseimicrobium gellanilyticum TaxID=748857 RepID=A0A366HH58_9BACT|nr:FAD:protein FMN transferase [Roseimicrobium gellanilyticum]RBP41266.1 thiamine biosynthesis lipoprotein [Roseimicrobium gellanilyticum]